MQNPTVRGEHDSDTPHRDTHYLLMLATQGRFRLNLDFEKIEFGTPTLLCIFPEQVHHLTDVQDRQGWVISFDPSIVDEKLLQLLENKIDAPLPLEKESIFYQQLFALMELLEKIQADRANPYTRKSIHFLLNAFMSLLAGELITRTSAEKTPETRSIIIKDTFRQLLKTHYKTWKQPAHYASKLAISVAHLNDTVKALTGTSVSVHIQQASILEAKRLLYFTDNSVKEVGYAVGYDEPVYFGKLFRKVTNLTPLEFRKQFRD